MPFYVSYLNLQHYDDQCKCVLIYIQNVSAYLLLVFVRVISVAYCNALCAENFFSFMIVYDCSLATLYTSGTHFLCAFNLIFIFL